MAELIEELKLRIRKAQSFGAWSYLKVTNATSVSVKYSLIPLKCAMTITFSEHLQKCKNFQKKRLCEI